MYYGYGFDPLYLVLMVPATLLTLFAQWRVRSSYAHWSKVRNARGLTGTDVAQILLPAENLTNVQMQTTPGQLSDHYDPQSNILRFSPEIAQQPSVASMAIAAHEIGHAAQDRDNYTWMKIRGGIVPLVQIGSALGYLVFFGGLLSQVPAIAWIGVGLTAMGLLFALVTLPVEFDASNRGMKMLIDNGVISNPEEQQAARSVLNAAALTYLAAAAQAAITVLYYVLLLMGNQRRSRNE